MLYIIKNIYLVIQLSIVILIVSFAIGCDKSTDNEAASESGLFTETITVDGLTRRYAIYIPKDLTNLSVPLIFELHGGGVYIEDMTGESGFKTPYKLWMDIADIEKFIVVYPEGLNGSYAKPTWHDCRSNEIGRAHV